MNIERSSAVTAVEKWFFTPLYYPRSPLQVIGWWERRRLLYNVSVGLAGLLTVGTAAVLGPFPSSPNPFFVPLMGVLLYGVLANICYSIGSVADLFLRRILGIRAPDIGPVIFRYGYVFSLGLTLLPIPVMIFGSIMRFVLGVGAAS